MQTIIIRNLEDLKSKIIRDIETMDRNFIDNTQEIQCSSMELDYFLNDLIPSVFSKIFNKMDYYVKSADSVNLYLTSCGKLIDETAVYTTDNLENYNKRVFTCLNVASKLEEYLNKIAKV